MIQQLNLTQNKIFQPKRSELPLPNCCFSGTTPKNNIAGAKAVNEHGDSLTVSFGSKPYQQYTPANIYQPFSLAVDKVVNNLINAVDGMIPYPQNFRQSWQMFPQKNSFAEAPGFKPDLSLNGEHTFNKGPKDGGIDVREKMLAATQLGYDTINSFPPGTAEYNSNVSAINLMSALFNGPAAGQKAYQIKPEFDINMNGRFDSDDAQVLALQDGDIDHLSSNDLNIATTNYTMNRGYTYATLPVSVQQN